MVEIQLHFDNKLITIIIFNKRDLGDNNISARMND